MTSERETTWAAMKIGWGRFFYITAWLGRFVFPVLFGYLMICSTGYALDGDWLMAGRTAFGAFGYVMLTVASLGYLRRKQ